MTAHTTIAVVADTHADESSRWAEHCAVMTWIADDIARRGCVLTMHAGDIYEAASTPTERAFVKAWCMRVCEASPLVVCGGNHEAAGDVAALGLLRTRHAIVATEVPLVTTHAGIAVAVLPWPRKAALLAQHGKVVDTATGDALATAALRETLRGLGAQVATHAGPRVLLAHALIDGAMTDHDQPLCGLPLSLTVEDLALARTQFCALGHIHRGSEWSAPVPTAYAASIRHCTFGEAASGKGYLLIHFDGARYVGFERVATPCRPMLLLRGRYHAGALRWTPPTLAAVRNAEVRLRYTVAAHERAAAQHEERAAKQALMAMGAYDAKIEADVQTVAVARAPEVARADTTETQLLARWDLRGEVPSMDERAALLAMLDAAEGDVVTGAGAAVAT